MHAIVLFAAMTATSGLFGGRHQKATHTYAPATTCQSGRCGTPATYAPAPVYAPAQAAAPAPRMAAAPATYRSYYYSAAPACTTGNCPRR